MPSLAKQLVELKKAGKGSGVGLSLRNIIGMMAKQLNIEVNISIDHRLIRPSDNKSIIGSNEKIKRELGWDNSVPWEQSLKDIICYWETNSNVFKV